MAKLIPSPPCAGLLPKTIGSLAIREVDVGPITLIAPFSGGGSATSDVLKAEFGFGFPSPNRALGENPRIAWFGLNQALLMGAACPALPQAACVDQSDGWVIVCLEGAKVQDVLARVVPIDLRAPVFKQGHTARTLVGHMHGAVTRMGDQRFELTAMRSMAATLVHELERAALGVSARSSQ